MNFIPIDTQNIVFRSDACGGQNRNIKMALMLKKFLSMSHHPELTSIEQNFYVSGHSYNRCDRSFGLIEKQKQVTENIFVQEHWINVIKQARKRIQNLLLLKCRKRLSF